MSGWSCPHNAENRCVILKFTVCEPGKKGCVLSKNGVFSDSVKPAFEDGRKREEPRGGFSFKKGSV